MDRLLVRQLTQAGHDVRTVEDLHLRAMPDATILDTAVRHSRIVITHNCDDFAELGRNLRARGEHHFGILLVRKDRDLSNHMTVADVVRAIANLAGTELDLRDQEITLNHYRW